MKYFGALAACVFGVLVLGVGTAAASNNFAAFGGAIEIAQPVHNYVFDLVSNTGNVPTADDYSGIYRSLTGKTAAAASRTCRRTTTSRPATARAARRASSSRWT